MAIADMAGKVSEMAKSRPIMSHAATGGGSILATLLVIQQLYGADIERIKNSVEDTIILKVEQAALKEDVGKVDQKVSTIDDKLDRVLFKLGDPAPATAAVRPTRYHQPDSMHAAGDTTTVRDTFRVFTYDTNMTNRQPQ